MRILPFEINDYPTYRYTQLAMETIINCELSGRYLESGDPDDMVMFTIKQFNFLSLFNLTSNELNSYACCTGLVNEWIFRGELCADARDIELVQILLELKTVEYVCFCI